MCIAILRTPGGIVTENQLMNSWINNPDGMGLMWAEDGEVKTWKSMDNIDELIQRYQKLEDEDRVVGIHFRIATHGSTSIRNCHPFKVRRTTGMMHNGMIPIFIPQNRDISDTVAFRDYVIKNLPENWMDNSSMISFLEEGIGFSKVVFLNHDESYLILGEEKGHWNINKDVWFSNTSYYPPVFKKSTKTTGTVSYTNDADWGSVQNTGSNASPTTHIRTQCDWCAEWFDATEEDLASPFMQCEKCLPVACEQCKCYLTDSEATAGDLCYDCQDWNEYASKSGVMCAAAT